MKLSGTALFLITASLSAVAAFGVVRGTGGFDVEARAQPGPVPSSGAQPAPPRMTGGASAAPDRPVPRPRKAKSPEPAHTSSDQSKSGAEANDLQYVFPVDNCHAAYARSHHDYPAADLFAERGCRFVAPVAGSVDEVTRTDVWDPARNAGATRGGLSVSIVGDDDVRYYGSHLESVPEDIQPGTLVAPGDTLGRVGDSGSAGGTGTHLHFGISWPSVDGRWWIRRGVLAPQPYLDAWRAGRSLSPAPAIRAAEQEKGSTARCRSYC